MHFLGKSAQKTGGTFALLHFLGKSAQKTRGVRKKLGTFWEKVRKKLEACAKNWRHFCTFSKIFCALFSKKCAKVRV